MSFFPLDRDILTSTIWADGTPEQKVLWFYLLLSANVRTGMVTETVPGIALRSGLTVAAVHAGLEWLSSPDPHSRTKEHDGRRIEVLPDGVRILNYEKYKNKDYSTPRVARHRNGKRGEKPLPSVTETTDTDTDTNKEEREPPFSPPWLKAIGVWCSVGTEIAGREVVIDSHSHKGDMEALLRLCKGSLEKVEQVMRLYWAYKVEKGQPTAPKWLVEDFDQYVYKAERPKRKTHEEQGWEAIDAAEAAFKAGDIEQAREHKRTADYYFDGSFTDPTEELKARGVRL